MFNEKRKLVQKALKSNEALLLLANPMSHIAGDTFHPYVQTPDFFYLTNCYEDQSALYIDKENIILFVVPKDPTKELWDGKMLGLEGAKKLGFKQTFPYTDLQVRVLSLLRKKDCLYCDLLQKPEWDKTLRSILEKPKGRTHQRHIDIKDSRNIIHPLRNLKTHAIEVESLQELGKITGTAYRNLLLSLKTFKNESEIEAFFYTEMKKNICESFAYGPICASDENSCTLHYHANNKKMQNFILVDVGFRKNYFNSDITRTYPFKKRFSKDQETIYNIVLECNKFIIKNIEVGVDTLSTLKQKANDFFAKALTPLKLKHGVEDYFPHGLGHSLGHDVHDVLGKDDLLQPGMLITVEPGLYFRHSNDPKSLKGFGVRIEDNILIGSTVHENLTRSAPKELKEIYKLMKI